MVNKSDIESVFNELKWIENNPYESADWIKGNHGWVGGYEEHLNWKEEKPPTEWIFKLWVKLKE